MSGGLPIVKMSGSGNDFIVLGSDAIRSLDLPPAEWARRACRRALSIGGDGVLLVEAGGADRVRVAFYNPDGSPAFCGNGSRCAARFAQLRGLAGEAMILETAVGEVPAQIEGDRVRLTLPPPEDRGTAVLRVGDETVRGRFVVAGVPHFVVDVEAIEDAPLERWGPGLRRHPHFGDDGANVDLLARRADGVLGLRTWERGVEGETLACGSGAVAAGFAAWLDGGPASARLVPRSERAVEVAFEGSLERPRSAVLTGDARVIFEGLALPEAWREG